MKKEINRKIGHVFLLLFVWTVEVTAEIQPFVIDHSSIDIEKIPGHWVEEVKQEQVLIQCVGQSHSYQYENGLLLLEQNNPHFAVQIADSIIDLNTENRLHILRSQYSTLYNKWQDKGDDKDYWSTEAGKGMTLDSAHQAISEGHPLTASLWCWCWDICNPTGFFSQSNDFTEEHIGWYLNAIDQFNQDVSISPTVFVYHTSVSDCSEYLNPDGPWRVTYFNEFIRQAAIQANGILLDQADIVNWNIDNTAQRIEPDDQGRTVYLRHMDYDESNLPDTMDGDHANDALCLRKASAIWYLAARLAGWDGCAAVQGDVTGDCRVDLEDFFVLAGVWLTTSDSPNWVSYADIAPAGGDGVINIEDFSAMGQAWFSYRCTVDYVSDLNNNCKVEIGDFVLLAESWLSASGDGNWNEKCDISPDTGDGIVDFYDFQRFSEEWLAGECYTSWTSDFNQDCKVDIADLAIFSNAWLSTEEMENWCQECDLETEMTPGMINLADFSIFSDQWMGHVQ